MLERGAVTCQLVKEEDWANNWKKYYKPTKIGDRIVIKPVWEECEAAENELLIELDPVWPLVQVPMKLLECVY